VATTTADYVIVGSGLTGAVIARMLVDAGRDVAVVDRRNHLGGNVHDWTHESGVRIHTYGPHYFRTNSSRIWEFVTRFTDFHDHGAVVSSMVDGRIERWPIAAEYIRRTIGDSWEPGFKGTPTNFEEASLAMMPRVIYEKFVKGYTEKQWGVPARSLDARLAGRFDVRDDDDVRLKRQRHQGVPLRGYARFMDAMLDGIPVELEFDYMARQDELRHRRRLIYTGPIDEYFGFDLGRLHYRAQRRRHQYLADEDEHQPVEQVNNPDPEGGDHIRTLEWKHLMPPNERASIKGTVITTETPFSPNNPNEYEYPFPDAANQALYRRYRARVRSLEHVIICGRLGEYRYYDMDQAIGRALRIAGRLLKE
jgi:UDP-galactopyranose mutase